MRLCGLCVVVLAALGTLGCRTRPMPPPPPDLQRAELAAGDLPAVDLNEGPDERCDPQHPNGYCPPETTCCPFSCWGGSDEAGWCAPGPGCPIC